MRANCGHVPKQGPKTRKSPNEAPTLPVAVCLWRKGRPSLAKLRVGTALGQCKITVATGAIKPQFKGQAAAERDRADRRQWGSAAGSVKARAPGGTVDAVDRKPGIQPHCPQNREAPVPVGYAAKVQTFRKPIHPWSHRSFATLSFRRRFPIVNTVSLPQVFRQTKRRTTPGGLPRSSYRRRLH